MVKKDKDGFVQIFHSPIIDRIRFMHNGICKIYYQDGRFLDFYTGCEAVYNSQWGTALSLDGEKLFVSSWENGLVAFCTRTGKKLWQYKRSRITSVFPYSGYLIACRYGKALLKLSLDSGEIIKELKSSTIQQMFEVDKNHLFVDCIRGRHCILTVAGLECVKNYQTSVVNPMNCLSHCIQRAYLKDGQLFIEGFEDYPNSNYATSQQAAFCRMIDPEFYK